MNSVPAEPDIGSPAGFAQVRMSFVTDRRLTANAVRLGIYWADRDSVPGSWTLRSDDARAQLAMGREAYEKALACLKSNGYAQAGETIRDTRGRVRTLPPTINADLIIARRASAGSADYGIPVVGSPAEFPQVTPNTAYRAPVNRETVDQAPVSRGVNHTENHTSDRRSPDGDRDKDPDRLDRRSPDGDRATQTRWVFSDEQMPRVLAIVADAAKTHLKIIVDPGSRVTRYLLRTLTRSGQRRIAHIDQYAPAVFATDPDKWRTLAVAAADYDGHVPDGYGAWDDYATDVLSSTGARARGKDYGAWTDQDVRDADGRLAEFLDLRDWTGA